MDPGRQVGIELKGKRLPNCLILKILLVSISVSYLTYNGAVQVLFSRDQNE